jgi:hypothetical protein
MLWKVGLCNPYVVVADIYVLKLAHGSLVARKSNLLDLEVVLIYLWFIIIELYIICQN